MASVGTYGAWSGLASGLLSGLQTGQSMAMNKQTMDLRKTEAQRQAERDARQIELDAAATARQQKQDAMAVEEFGMKKSEFADTQKRNASADARAGDELALRKSADKRAESADQREASKLSAQEKYQRDMALVNNLPDMNVPNTEDQLQAAKEVFGPDVVRVHLWHDETDPNKTEIVVAAVDANGDFYTKKRVKYADAVNHLRQQFAAVPGVDPPRDQAAQGRKIVSGPDGRIVSVDAESGDVQTLLPGEAKVSPFTLDENKRRAAAADKASEQQATAEDTLVGLTTERDGWLKRKDALLKKSKTADTSGIDDQLTIIEGKIAQSQAVIKRLSGGRGIGAPVPAAPQTGLNAGLGGTAPTAAPSAPAATSQGGPPTISTQEQFDSLPPGTEYIDANDGKRYKRP